MTSGASRDTRMYVRKLLLAFAESKGVTLQDPFVVRGANQCYACCHHSRRRPDGSCSRYCTSDVSSVINPGVTVIHNNFGYR